MNVRTASIVVFTLVCICARPRAAQDALPLDWRLSDGPYEGGASDILLAPSGVIFAATSNGVLRSQDDGRTWTPCDMPRSLSYQGTKLVRRAPDGQLFVAMSQQDMMRYADESCRIASPLQLSAEFNSPRSVDALEILPSGRILASRFVIGLFWSDDRGATWRKATGTEDTWISSIHVLGTHILAATANGRMLESRDHGKTWFRVAQGNEARTSIANGRVVVTGTGLPQKLTAGRNGSVIGAGAGVYSTTNGGRDWQRLGLEDRLVWTLTLAERRRMFADVQRQLFAAVEIQRPSDAMPDFERDRPPNAMFRSRDDGRTWVQMPPAIRGRVNAMAYTRGGTLIAGTGEGLYRSRNDGQTWSFTGVMPARLGSIAVAADNAILANQQKYSAGPTWRSMDGGRTWRRLGSLTQAPLVLLRNGRLFSGRGISADHGTTWQRIGLSWPVDAFLELSDGTLLAGTYMGLFRSTDGGATWIERSSGLTRFDIKALVLLNERTILAATGDGMFRSIDGGMSWRALDERSPRHPPGITHLVRDPEGRIVAAAFKGLFEYARETAAWNLIAEMPSPVEALAADDNGQIWVGTKASGLLMVRRERDEWRQRSAGLSGRAISALAFDRANHVIASTDRGTYWTSLPGIRTSR